MSCGHAEDGVRCAGPECNKLGHKSQVRLRLNTADHCKNFAVKCVNNLLKYTVVNCSLLQYYDCRVLTVMPALDSDIPAAQSNAPYVGLLNNLNTVTIRAT